jgi:hypothetical protein
VPATNREDIDRDHRGWWWRRRYGINGHAGVCGLALIGIGDRGHGHLQSEVGKGRSIQTAVGYCSVLRAPADNIFTSHSTLVSLGPVTVA